MSLRFPITDTIAISAHEPPLISPERLRAIKRQRAQWYIDNFISRRPLQPAKGQEYNKVVSVARTPHRPADPQEIQSTSENSTTADSSLSKTLSACHSTAYKSHLIALESIIDTCFTCRSTTDQTQLEEARKSLSTYLKTLKFPSVSKLCAPNTDADDNTYDSLIIRQIQEKRKELLTILNSSSTFKQCPTPDSLDSSIFVVKRKLCGALGMVQCPALHNKRLARRTVAVTKSQPSSSFLSQFQLPNMESNNITSASLSEDILSHENRKRPLDSAQNNTAKKRLIMMSNNKEASLDPLQSSPAK